MRRCHAALAFTLPLAFVLLATALPTSAHARERWAFGRHVWFEGGMGASHYTGLRNGNGALYLRSTVGVRLGETSGIEFSADGAFDGIGGATGGGFAVNYVAFPGTDKIRLRIGSRLRALAVGPHLAVLDREPPKSHLSAVTLDTGVDLGVASQWNWGPFYVGVEWVGLYQPLVAFETEYLHHRDGDVVDHSPGDWKGQELPAEIRAFTFLTGLTF